MPSGSLLATYAIAVAVQSVDVIANYANRTLYICRAVATASGAVDVAGNGDACAGVIRVALRRLLRPYRDHLGDWFSGHHLAYGLFPSLDTVRKSDFVGYGLAACDAMGPHHCGALGEAGVVYLRCFERNRASPGDTPYGDLRGFRRRSHSPGRRYGTGRPRGGQWGRGRRDRIRPRRSRSRSCLIQSAAAEGEQSSRRQ